MGNKENIIKAFLDIELGGEEFLNIWKANNRAVSLDELVRIINRHGDLTTQSVLKRKGSEEDKIRDLKSEFYYGLSEYNRDLKRTEKAFQSLEMKIEPPELVNIFGDFSNNCSMAVNSFGEIYVVDNEEAKIKVYSADGKVIREIGEKVKDIFMKGEVGKSRLSSPMDIAMNHDDTFWVLERRNPILHLMNREGVCLEVFRLSDLFRKYSDEIYQEGLDREYQLKPKPPTRFLKGFKTDNDDNIKHMEHLFVVTLPKSNLLYILHGSVSPSIHYQVLITDKERYAVRDLTGIHTDENYKRVDRAWMTTKDSQVVIMYDDFKMEFYDEKMNLVKTLTVEQLGETNLLSGSFDSQGRIHIQNGPLITVHDSEGKFLTCTGKMLEKDYTLSLGVIKGIAFSPDNKSIYINSQQQGKIFHYRWK